MSLQEIRLITLEDKIQELTKTVETISRQLSESEKLREDVRKIEASLRVLRINLPDGTSIPLRDLG